MGHDLDDEELRATKDKFYKNKEFNKKQINEVVKRLIRNEEKKNENS